MIITHPVSTAALWQFPIHTGNPAARPRPHAAEILINAAQVSSAFIQGFCFLRAIALEFYFVETRENFMGVTLKDPCVSQIVLGNIMCTCNRK